MKYVSIAIVIIFIGLVVGFWVKKAPQEEQVVPVVEEPKVEETVQKPEEPKKEGEA